MTKFKGLYRIESMRKPGWDYGANGFYFVTLCTNDRIKHFGTVRWKKMELSKFGQIANKCWLEIPDHFPFVILHAHVIMPEHIHGIIEIAKNPAPSEMQYFASQPDSPNDGRNTNDEHDPINPTDQNLPQPKNPFKFTPQPQFHKTKFGPQSQNLGSIIRGFKVGVTKNVRKKNPNFSWQKDYHDRIIMDQKAFDNISRYIINNPKNYKG